MADDPNVPYPTIDAIARRIEERVEKNSKREEDVLWYLRLFIGILVVCLPGSLVLGAFLGAWPGHVLVATLAGAVIWCLNKMDQIRKDNGDLLQSLPMLRLVTTEKAEQVAIEWFQETIRRRKS